MEWRIFDASGMDIWPTGFPNRRGEDNTFLKKRTFKMNGRRFNASFLKEDEELVRSSTVDIAKWRREFDVGRRRVLKKSI